MYLNGLGDNNSASEVTTIWRYTNVYIIIIIIIMHIKFTISRLR